MTPSVEATFTALSDPTRRAVVNLLRREPRRAGEIASAFGMTAPAMSRHLRVLRKSGLVEEQSLDGDARVRVYRLKREPFNALRDWLDEIESFWTVQLGSFKQHAERARRRGPRD